MRLTGRPSCPGVARMTGLQGLQRTAKVAPVARDLTTTRKAEPRKPLYSSE